MMQRHWLHSRKGNSSSWQPIKRVVMYSLPTPIMSFRWRNLISLKFASIFPANSDRLLSYIKIASGESRFLQQLPGCLLCYLHKAFIYSENIKLAPYVNKMDDILVVHLQSDGHKNYIYNVYFEDIMLSPIMINRYRECRFDKLTGWSNLCEKLFEFESCETDSM